MSESDLSEVSDVEAENSDIEAENSDVEAENSLTKAKKEAFIINNVPALNAKLGAIQLNLDWVEKLDITVNVEENECVVDEADDNTDSKAENDFKREMSFYNQALAAVTKAFKRLHKQGITTRRPDDFFAEMAKSDSHMNKVREKLLSKQNFVERKEKIKAIRDQKKQGKKIQQQILSERKTEKKKMINALKKTKKGKMDADTLLGTKKDAPKGGPKFNRGKKNREFKNSRFGYGGRKKGSKWNTSESTSSWGGKASGSSWGGKASGFKDKKFGKQRPKGPHRRRR